MSPENTETLRRRRASSVRPLSARARFTACGLRTDGAVVCWGADSYDDRRDGGADVAATARSARARFHSCGLRTDGAVDCWGSY